ncbi:MAG: type II toxin-antitoxin system HicA family toxin [Oscillospiraceae bacterium]|jgi:predicted RNA binding protein YcfA (HicA-like mRNA interferase family)|nr:type II toxin-antitoxin system HicA family toxin [Oscillospiraceae bacterium]
MHKLPVIKAKDMYGLLIQYGCEEKTVRGSHHKIYNPKTGRTSVIAIHSGKDVTRAVFAAILAQLGIDIDDFVRFIK